MKVLFLGYSDKETSLIQFLKTKSCEIDWTDQLVSAEQVSQADLVVSFGFKFIIKEEILSKAKRPIINLHISYLPYNRGAHPNFWAFAEGTPHGVSIHHIDKGVDTGEIVLQRKVKFYDLQKTFSETYQSLRMEIENLFMENWELIRDFKYSSKAQQQKGTVHKVSELPSFSGGWESRVVDALGELSQPSARQEMIFGTVQLGMPYGINNQAGKPDLNQAQAMLETARRQGVKYLDTSDLYGSSSEVIAKFGSDRFRVLTKFALDGKFSFTEKLQNTLKLLNAKSIQSYSFHKFSDFESFSAWNEVHEAKENGLISNLGVSVYGNDQLEKAIQSPEIDLIQLPFNVLDNYSRRGRLLRMAERHGKTIHVRSIYLQGLLLMSFDKFPENLRPLIEPIKQIREIASRNSISTEQLCWSYAKSFDEIDGIVIGADNESQVQSNIELSKAPSLSNEVRRKIHDVHIANGNLLNPSSWSVK